MPDPTPGWFDPESKRYAGDTEPTRLATIHVQVTAGRLAALARNVAASVGARPSEVYAAAGPDGAVEVWHQIRPPAPITGSLELDLDNFYLYDPGEKPGEAAELGVAVKGSGHGEFAQTTLPHPDGRLVAERLARFYRLIPDTEPTTTPPQGDDPDV